MADDLRTPDVRFDGFGVTVPSAAEAATALATLLTNWSIAHPGRRILHISTGLVAAGPGLEMTALFAYVVDGGAALVATEAIAIADERAGAVLLAEEIVADAQQTEP